MALVKSGCDAWSNNGHFATMRGMSLETPEQKDGKGPSLRRHAGVSETISLDITLLPFFLFTPVELFSATESVLHSTLWFDIVSRILCIVFGTR